MVLIRVVAEEKVRVWGAETAQDETSVELPPTVQVLALVDCDTKPTALVTVTAVVVAIVTKVSTGMVCTAVMTL